MQETYLPSEDTNYCFSASTKALTFSTPVNRETRNCRLVTMQILVAGTAELAEPVVPLKLPLPTPQPPCQAPQQSSLISCVVARTPHII